MVVEICDPVGHNLAGQAQVGPPLVQMDLSCHRQKIKVKIKIKIASQNVKSCQTVTASGMKISRNRAKEGNI